MNPYVAQYSSRLISILLAIALAGVVSAGFGFQIITGEEPCSLCFLQRIAMTGAAIGQLLNFQFGVKMSHHALSLFHCLFGATVSLTQISEQICPGFPKSDTPVLGLSLYTWALITFFCALATIGTLMSLYKPEWKPMHSAFLKHLERFAFFYVLLIILADIVSGAMICGIGPCPK